MFQTTNQYNSGFSWGYKSTSTTGAPATFIRLQLQQPQEAMMLHGQNPAEGAGGARLGAGVLDGKTIGKPWENDGFSWDFMGFTLQQFEVI